MYGWGDEDGRTTTTTTTTMMARSAQGQGQWGQDETKEFIKIRTQLERDSALTKRSKVLWDAVSSKMSERGFIRTSDQCKCKWKNLLNRYKGQETSDPENVRQCPFFEELHALFAEREKNMQRLLLETEMGSPRSTKKMKGSSNAGQSSDELSENEEFDKEGTDEDIPTATTTSTRRKRKAEKIALDKSSKATNAAFSNSENDIQEMLKQFFEHQQRMEKQWMEMMDRRAYEQQLFEQEWRQSMEKHERERLMVEQSWREREEQRRLREESRAERRDALLTTLLNNLLHENNL